MTVADDIQRTKCPPVGDIPTPGLYFDGDVYAHHGYWGENLDNRSNLLEGFTNIVSTGMRVERPDGTVVIVPYYTDIFSSQVDFISEFRYLLHSSDDDPISGQPYTFTLLDALGDPIAGTTREDVWTGCITYPPPRNLTVVISGLDVDLSWDAVPVADGFDPANGIGFYQIWTWPLDPGTDTNYGANGISSTSHLLPWDGFGGWAPGRPNGYDNGAALSELDNGNYGLLVEAFSQPDPSNPGHGHECSVKDHAKDLFFSKTDDSITFFTP